MIGPPTHEHVQEVLNTDDHGEAAALLRWLPGGFQRYRIMQWQRANFLDTDHHRL